MPIQQMKMDEHGLYVRTNGGIYRPERSKSSHTGIGMRGVSDFDIYHKYNVRNVSFTPNCKVTDRIFEITEVWHFHGQYLYHGGHLPSHECWDPED